MLVDGSLDQTLQPKGKGGARSRVGRNRDFTKPVNFCSADLVEYARDNHKLDLH
jgi:hypothetical protein